MKKGLSTAIMVFGILLLISLSLLFYFVGKGRGGVTGNVINSGPEKIVDSDVKAEKLNQQSNTKEDITYKVVVEDELTNDPLEDAFIYLDGSLAGKTSRKGELYIENVKMGKHSIRAEYKGQSDVKTADISEEDNELVINLIAPRTITLELKDSETNKPISDVKVFLEATNGKAHYNPLSTADDGKTQFNDVLPGDYQVRIEEFPEAKPSKLVTVEDKNFISVDVDMPNPRFRGSSINCKEEIPFLGESYGECTVNLKNDGNTDSKDTTVLLYIYKEEDGSFIKIGEETLDFGSVANGQIVSKTTKRFDVFSRFTTEHVVAVIYEGWKYTPEDDSQIGDVTIPPTLMNKFIADSATWCSENIQQCAETATNTAKTVVGIIAAI
jgi:hypothetical protein